MGTLYIDGIGLPPLPTIEAEPTGFEDHYFGDEPMACESFSCDVDWNMTAREWRNAWAIIHGYHNWTHYKRPRMKQRWRRRVRENRYANFQRILQEKN